MQFCNIPNMPVLRSKWAVFVVLFLCILLGTIFVWEIGYNTSQSMPRGWYYRVRRQTIRRGDIVAACLSPAWASIGLRRHYLEKGRCRSGAAPVLKTVIALPGDMVSVTDKGFFINDVFIIAPRQQRDHSGFLVTHSSINIDSIADGYWLYGAGDPQYSWDSRYWGSVYRSDILGVYLQIRW